MSQFTIQAIVSTPVAKLEKKGIQEGRDLADAVARFLRVHFRFADGEPVEKLELTELKVKIRTPGK